MNFNQLLGQAAPVSTGIHNPAINPLLGSGIDVSYTNSGTYLAKLVVILWSIILTLGGLAVMIFFARGAVSWITSAGDKSKVEAARNSITNALIGMALLFGAMAFANFIGPAIGFDLLQLQFTTPSDLGTI